MRLPKLAKPVMRRANIAGIKAGINAQSPLCMEACKQISDPVARNNCYKQCNIDYYTGSGSMPIFP